MDLSFPAAHKARYDNFEIDGVLDETLREGAERCMFSVHPESRIPLAKAAINAGMTDLVYGSGPSDPAHLVADLIEKDARHAMRCGR